MTSSFVALNIPSDATCLIEASAGTGKTYTMTEIYLRLILGVNCQPLTVEQILVVTFTNAATQELRDRIRERILNAEQLFYRYLDEQQNGNNHLQDSSFEHTLFNILNDAGEDLNLATLRLKVAAQDMDLAAIYTIHSFCQKMLSRFSFLSGLPFELTLQPNENELLTRLSQEVWRELYYPLDKQFLPLVITHLKSPDEALNSVRHLLGNPQPDNPFAYHFSFAHYFAEKQQHIKQIQQFWLNNGEQLFQDCQNTRQTQLYGNKYTQKSLDKAFAAWQQWASHPTTAIPDYEMFTQQKMVDTHNATKGDLIIPELIQPFQTLVEHFDQHFSEQAEKSAILLHFYHTLQNKVDEYKQHNPEKSFNDMLSLLNRALKAEQGEKLANEIRQLYQFAMIDEFQDTDIQQYEIFSRLFMNTTPSRGFIMIGDPKQSIYKFRGADIATYIKAAKQAQQRETLNTNYRSSPKLVEAVNLLFDFASDNSHSPLLHKEIPFDAVNYKEQPVLNGANNVMLYLQADRFDEKLAAIQCAQQIHQQLKQSIKEKQLFIEQRFICHSLEEAQNKQQELIKKEQRAHRIILTKYEIEKSENEYVVLGKKPILPADIAILVNKGTQAQLIRDALNQFGLSSVYLSERSNIFDTQEAHDLFALLNACINPYNQGAILSSLGSFLWAKSADELAILQQSNHPEEWDNWISRFVHFHEIWQRQGILAMLHHIFEHYLFQAIAQFEHKDRRITNFFHLAELLQQASPTVENEHALLHWFKQNLTDVGSDITEQELRLESEQDLIKIITIHKSKGLQYPVVWLPFVGTDKGKKKSNTSRLNTIRYHDDLRWEFELPQSEADEIKQLENNAENLRLLYVALTRAESQINLILPARFVGKQNAKNRSKLQWNSLLYLLTNGEFQSDSISEMPKETTSYFDDKKITYGAIHLSEHSTNEYDKWNLADYLTQDHDLSVKEMPDAIPHNIGNITSYSALVRSKHSRSSNYDEEDEKENNNQQPTHAEKEQNSRFNLPKGATIGTEIHNLLETFRFEEIDSAIKNQDKTTRFHKKLSEFCEVLNLEDPIKWQAVLMEWFEDIILTPFGNHFCLKDISSQHCFKEWEFVLRLNNKNALPQLNSLLRENTVLIQKYELADLQLNELQGYIHGFVDCLCEHNGQYYVIDYKSNHLGHHFDDYAPDKIEHAFATNRFDLQAILYSVAVHRMLRFRLGKTYDYEKHFGGVAYLFLRGMNRETNSGVYFDKPSYTLIDQLDQLFA